LRSQLEQRFAPLPAEVIKQLEQADAEQLMRWGTRVADARSLDDVFGNGDASPAAAPAVAGLRTATVWERGYAPRPRAQKRDNLDPIQPPEVETTHESRRAAALPHRQPTGRCRT